MIKTPIRFLLLCLYWEDTPSSLFFLVTIVSRTEIDGKSKIVVVDGTGIEGTLQMATPVWVTTV